MADAWSLGLAVGVAVGSLVTLIGIVMAEELAVEPPAEIDWQAWAIPPARERRERRCGS